MTRTLHAILLRSGAKIHLLQCIVEGRGHFDCLGHKYVLWTRLTGKIITNCVVVLVSVYTYPTLKTSANFRKAELMRMGKGYFSKRRGNLTMASHCSPTLADLKPEMLFEE